MQGLGVEDELAALGARIGGRDRDFAAEFVRLCGFAFGDTFALRRVPGIELAATLTLPLGADLIGL